jgi:hypothetical protein
MKCIVRVEGGGVVHFYQAARMEMSTALSTFLPMYLH